MIGFCTHIKEQRRYHAYRRILESSPCSLTLTVIDIDKKNHTYLRNVYTCICKEILLINTGMLYYPHYYYKFYSLKKQSLEIGQTIKIFNKITNKQKINDDDFSLYLKKEYILDNVMCSTFSYALYKQPVNIINKMYHLRKKLWLDARKKLKSTPHQLYSLIFLGKKISTSKVINHIKQDCKSWGISHHLARSGLHLVAFVFIWEKLFYYMPLVGWLKQIIIILITCFYILLSWPSISFIRSCLVFLSYKLAYLCSQQTFSIHLMSVISLLVLFINPYILFFLDFQLSFGITFLLAWINHVRIVKSRN